MYRKIKNKFTRRKVLTRGLHYQYQADLVDYSALKRDNDGYTFVLTIIDCFSRFALAIPLKSKRGVDVAAALEKCFKSQMKPPLKLQTDLGKEFYNADVKRILERYRIHHFSTDQELKAQIVERFNRTLRETIKKSMAYRGSLRYIHVLPDFLHGYNNRIHSSISPYAPVQVNKNNEKAVHNIQYGQYLDAMKKRHKYDIGDRVRIAAYRGPFRKSYQDKTFTKEVFEIVDTIHSNPPTYRIKDLKKGDVIDGAFYIEQLQRVSK